MIVRIIPNKEEIVQYYIKELHTVNECAEHFHMSKSKFYTCLKEYDIVRSQEDKSRVYSRVQNTDDIKQKIAQNRNPKSYVNYLSNSEFMIKTNKYSVDWLKEEYCSKNTSLEEICDRLQVSTTVFYQICHHYQISKTNEQRYNNIKKTNINKYGVLCTLQLDDVKAKTKQTCLEKYGVDNVMQVEEVKDRIRNTVAQKHGVDNYVQKNIQHYDIWSSKEKIKEFLLSFGEEKASVYMLSKYFNVSLSGLRKYIHKLDIDDLVTWYYSRSHYEDEILSFLSTLDISNITINDRTVLEGQEIDIYLPDYKIGIEFNGDYWHSDIYHMDHNGRSTYHQEKSLLAEQKGIFLFHIFEHEWNDPSIKQNILNRLTTLLQKNFIKIPGRKCEIVELDKQQKKDFLNENHIQGNDHSSKYYGLKYNGEIVSCMTFVHPKNDKYTWELSRFCNKHNTIVQGGASKLFSYFVKMLKTGETISSYNDITKTQGKLYEILGFKCVSINNPNYVWINFQTGDIRTRYQEQKAGEIKRMHGLGYHRICDCGTKTWMYTKN